MNTDKLSKIQQDIAILSEAIFQLAELGKMGPYSNNNDFDDIQEKLDAVCIQPYSCHHEPQKKNSEFDS